MNNGTLENPAARTHGRDTPDELTKLKKELLQAEVRLAKARATVTGAEIDIRVLNARLKAFARYLFVLCAVRARIKFGGRLRFFKGAGLVLIGALRFVLLSMNWLLGTPVPLEIAPLGSRPGPNRWFNWSSGLSASG